MTPLSKGKKEPDNPLVQKIRALFFREKVTILFFVVYFLLGLFIFRDYGVAWDELYQHAVGAVNINYVVKGDNYLFSETYPDRFYGPVYETAVVSLGTVLGVSSYAESPNRRTFLFRHIANFSTFFVGVVFFYLLCRHRFKNYKIALLGTTFLVLTPRLFADAFYNSKDTVFLAFLVITFYWFVKFFERKTIKGVLILSLVSAVSIASRVTAVIVPLFVLLFMLADQVFIVEQRKRYKQNITFFVLYMGITICFVVSMWPFLWSDPINRFILVWDRFAHYVMDVKNLYFGTYVSARNLPWHYIPVWISISTPPLYLALFSIGATNIFLNAKKDIKKFYIECKEDVLFLLWFFLPIGMVIVFRSTLYNAWRHMFFVYPAFLLISLRGVVYIQVLIQQYLKKPYILRLFFVAIFISLAYTAKIMVQSHPYEHIYFNFLVGNDMKVVRKLFETDYWGLSYRKGLEYVLEHDKSNSVVIAVENDPGRKNAIILPESESQRIKFVDEIKDATYYVTTFFNSRKNPPYKELYSVSVRGAKIMSVYMVR